MAAKRLNQATLTVTTEVLDKELHKDLKNYEDAASENRLQEAEIIKSKRKSVSIYG